MQPRRLPSEDDTSAHIREVVAAAQDRKAEDLRILDLQGIAVFTDFFIVCTGANRRQVQAISDAVEERLRAAKSRPLHTEGHSLGQWVLMDYGTFVVHVFDPERRAFYGLERLWGDAPDVTERFSA